MRAMHNPDRLNHRVSWREFGAGPPVMLVHGLGSSGADWAFQIPPLAATRRVIVPDLRGSGRHAGQRGPFSIAMFADDLWAVADALSIAQLDLVGFSLGGAVALEMALARPGRVARLATINSLPSYRVDHWRKWLEVHVQAAMVRTLGLPRVARMVSKRLFPHPHQAPMRERVVAVLGANPVRAYLDTANALAGWCAGERIGDLRARTLLIAAEHDYTPLEEKRHWAQRMHAAFAVVRGSRHGTPFDAIAATNALLTAFLADAPLPADESLAIDPPERMPGAPPPGILEAFAADA
jgi:pimeloyl-ACP methyl ester carboxylesterase